MNIGYDANVFHGKCRADCFMMAVIRCKSNAVVLRFRVTASRRCGWCRLRFGRSGIAVVRSYLHFVRSLDGFLIIASEFGEAVGEDVGDAEVHDYESDCFFGKIVFR